MSSQKTLEQLLLERGLLRLENLVQALQIQHKTGEPLEEILVSQGFITRAEIGMLLSSLPAAPPSAPSSSSAGPPRPSGSNSSLQVLGARRPPTQNLPRIGSNAGLPTAPQASSPSQNALPSLPSHPSSRPPTQSPPAFQPQAYPPQRPTTNLPRFTPGILPPSQRKSDPNSTYVPELAFDSTFSPLPAPSQDSLDATFAPPPSARPPSSPSPQRLHAAPSPRPSPSPSPLEAPLSAFDLTSSPLITQERPFVSPPTAPSSLLGSQDFLPAASSPLFPPERSRSSRPAPLQPEHPRPRSKTPAPLDEEDLLNLLEPESLSLPPDGFLEPLSQHVPSQQASPPLLLGKHGSQAWLDTIDPKSPEALARLQQIVESPGSSPPSPSDSLPSLVGSITPPPALSPPREPSRASLIAIKLTRDPSALSTPPSETPSSSSPPLDLPPSERKKPSEKEKPPLSSPELPPPSSSQGIGPPLSSSQGIGPPPSSSQGIGPPPSSSQGIGPPPSSSQSIASPGGRPKLRGSLCVHCNHQHEKIVAVCFRCRSLLNVPSPDDTLVGQVFANRFVLNGKLGAGGMGMVYHATDRETGEFIAVKILPLQMSTDADILKRFQREAALQMAIKHPKVVRTVYHGTEEKFGAFLAMELLVGEDMKGYRKRNPRLSPQDVLLLFGQLCDAMEHTHQMGVIHRDLKPANIFLLHNETSPLAELRVIDFGIAKLTHDETSQLTLTGMFLGTPTYMSPEQAAASKKIDSRSDIYTLGIILFEALTGMPPFYGEILAKIIMDHIYTPAPQLAQIRPEQRWPSALQLLLDRLLAKDPAHRPASMKEVKDALFRALEGVESFGTSDGSAAKPVEASLSVRLKEAANKLLSAYELPHLPPDLPDAEIYQRLGEALRLPRTPISASSDDILVGMLLEDFLQDAPPPAPAESGPAVKTQTVLLPKRSQEALPPSDTPKLLFLFFLTALTSLVLGFFVSRYFASPAVPPIPDTFPASQPSSRPASLPPSPPAASPSRLSEPAPSDASSPEETPEPLPPKKKLRKASRLPLKRKAPLPPTRSTKKRTPPPAVKKQPAARKPTPSAATPPRSED